MKVSRSIAPLFKAEMLIFPLFVGCGVFNGKEAASIFPAPGMQSPHQLFCRPTKTWVQAGILLIEINKSFDVPEADLRKSKHNNSLAPPLTTSPTPIVAQWPSRDVGHLDICPNFNVQQLPTCMV